MGEKFKGTGKGDDAKKRKRKKLRKIVFSKFLLFVGLILQML